MRDASTIARVDKRESKKKRIAALRSVVERLQSIPVGIRPEYKTAGVGASLAPGLPGPGLVGGVLNEMVAAHRDRPAAFGFLFALTAAAMREREGHAFFVATQDVLNFGIPYGHGLNQLGVDIGRLFLVTTETDKDTLWALEETLRSEAKPAMVMGAVKANLDLTQSRRLNLAAATHMTPLALLRGTTSAASPTAAATRWRIAPAPAARDRFEMLTHWRWHVTLERCRNGRTGDWMIEWDPAAHRFHKVERTSHEPEMASLGPAPEDSIASPTGLSDIPETHDRP